MYIALECLHMRYPTYRALTSPAERQLYQMYLALKGCKEKHIQWHHESERAIHKDYMHAIDPNTRP
ncbi:MAG TPA: hypothetical protein VI542_25910 [Candidatus Tectomicrobia bacterium]